MSIERLRAAIDACAESLNELRESLEVLDESSAKDEERLARIISDAVVKRFEVAFEYAWKLMKTAAEYQGDEVFGPRPAIQDAIRYGWIDDPDFWANALEARNGSVHDYFGLSHEAYFAIIKKFVTKTNEMIENIKRIPGSVQAN